MLENYIEKKIEENNIIEITDGTYFSNELEEKAKEVNIILHLTELVGKRGQNTNLSEFTIDDENHQVSVCPNGQVPTSIKYDEEKEILTAKFNNELCKTCPFKEKYCAKPQKKLQLYVLVILQLEEQKLLVKGKMKNIK